MTIALHCQHHADHRDARKCGQVFLSIQNGCVMIVSIHNGERHINLLSGDDLLRLLKEEKASREKVLQLQ